MYFTKYIIKYKKLIYFSNNMTKSEFNRNFSLSFDGKFKGFDYIENKDLFVHKLQRLLRRLERTTGVSDRLTMKFKAIRLYFIVGNI